MNWRIIGWDHYTDDDFFRVLDSERYKKRWAQRGRPIIRRNGCLDFHNPDTLEEIIREDQARLSRATSARNRWIIRNGIDAARSWLRQVEWILDELDATRSDR